MEVPVLHSTLPRQGKPSNSSGYPSACSSPPLHDSSAPPSSAKLPVPPYLPLSPSSTTPSSNLCSTTQSGISTTSPLLPSGLPSLPPCSLRVSSSSPCPAFFPSIFTSSSPRHLPALSGSEDFSSFPAAILFQVASFLDPVDVNNLLSTCTRWHSLCTLGLQPLWREFVNRTFGRKYENYVAFTGDGDWRSLYLKIARFISNLKRGHAEKRRFPRLLLPPISNTYEGCLAMTTDCTRLLWENGKALQCLDVDVGKEVWRVDLEEYRKKGSNRRNGKPSNLGSDSDASATATSHSSRSSTGRTSCCARASSVVIGRSKVFLHLEHQVHVYRLNDGTFVTTLRTPLEEGEGPATFVGNNMPLDVSLRNEHFTFLTKTALFVFHSESLELLYRIQHRELTPAMDTCEDIDFCWAGNRCCGSVRGFDIAMDTAFPESSSSEKTVMHNNCDVPFGSSDATEDIPLACGRLPDCVYKPDCFCRPDAVFTQSTLLCEASTFACTTDTNSDKGKRPCEDGFSGQWDSEASYAENTGVLPVGSPSSATNWFSLKHRQPSKGEPATGRTLRCQRHLSCASCSENTYGTSGPFSEQYGCLFGSPVSPFRDRCQFISSTRKLHGEQRPSVTAKGSSMYSGEPSLQDNNVGAKDGRPVEVRVNRCDTEKCVADCREVKGGFLVDQASPSFTQWTPEGESILYTQKQLCVQSLPFGERDLVPPSSLYRRHPCTAAQRHGHPTYLFQSGRNSQSSPSSSRFHIGFHNSSAPKTEGPLRSLSKKQPVLCKVVACKTPIGCGGVGIRRYQNSECFECGADKLSFRSRCQQSCRHIVTWLVKRSKTIKLWDIRDGANICTLHAHDSPIQKVRHVMNWKEITEYFLASLDIVGVVKIWGSGARGFCCLQKLQPEHNSCVFRMSFSSTHLATMSKESPASEVVVTVWKFDQEKATVAMERFQQQRAIGSGVDNRVMDRQTSTSSRLENSGTGYSSRTIYKRKEDDRAQGDAQHSRMRVKLCSAQYLKEAAENRDSAQIKEAPLIGVDTRSWTLEQRRIENPAAVRYKRGASVASLDNGKEIVISQCANSFCPGKNRLVSAVHATGSRLLPTRRVYRSNIANNSEREPLRRAFGKLAVPSLSHPPRHYFCNQVAMDPEDPSPYVNQAYLLDTRSTVTLGEDTKASLSSESNSRARNSPRDLNMKNTWSSDRKSNSPDFGNPSERNCSGGPLDASERTCCAILPPCNVVAFVGAGDVSAFEDTPRYRGKTGCHRSGATYGKADCRAAPSKGVLPHADFARLIPTDIAAGSHGDRVELSHINKNEPVQQFSQSPSHNPSGTYKKSMAKQASGPGRANRIHSPEEAILEELQSPSTNGTQTEGNGKSDDQEGAITPVVLEKEVSFSAGMTAYYADFIDGQLLALWHFTVSPSSREHSAFQYSLSDWKIYDCLRKTENPLQTLPDDNERKECLPRMKHRWLSRQREVGSIIYEPRVNPQPAALGAAEAANSGDQRSASAQRTEEVFNAPVFSMRNRGDVWTLLDWKCLSFEPDGDVTVFDFCSLSAAKLQNT